jgi:hypothetical protein
MQNQSQPYARPYAALAVLCTATFVASLDLFIVNVAFNAIGNEYRTASLGMTPRTRPPRTSAETVAETA